MIALLIKNWKLLLDILIIVGAVILFSFFDPLGIFNNTQTQKTAYLVSGVRSIGQLVTAEYYGEVMSSWNDYQMKEFPEDTLSGNAKMMYLDLMQVFSNTDIKFKKLYPDELAELRKSYPGELYSKFIIFLGDKNYNFPLRQIYNEKDGQPKKNAEKKILGRLYTQIKEKHKALSKQFKNQPDELFPAYQKYLSKLPDFLDGFMDYYYQLTKIHQQTKKGQRSRIVFIGRGWVKAGFDFGSFDEQNFQYDEANNIVHFFGLRPQILDTDINPWFIPELKVKGFELVDYSKDMDFEKAKKVKHQCKLDLLEKAREADIVGQAQANGEQALQSFFSIVLDAPDLEIAFHAKPFDKDWAILSSDTLIDLREALYIDSLYQHELLLKADTLHALSASLLSYREKQFGEFIHALKTLPFVKKGYTFNYFSMSVAHMLRDSRNVSADDLGYLKMIRDTISVAGSNPPVLGTRTSFDHAIWFDVPRAFMHDFNHSLQLLEGLTFTFDSTVLMPSTSFSLSEREKTFIYDSTLIEHWNSLDMDGTTYIQFTYPALYSSKKKLYDPYKYDLLPFSNLKEKDFKDENELRLYLDTIPPARIANKELQNLNNLEREHINKYILGIYLYKKKADPIKSFTHKLNQLFAEKTTH